MTLWTFTTRDPAEAEKLSLLCVSEQLIGTTETRALDTPPVSRPAPAKRTAKPAGAWSDPEARRLRTKVQGWANANMRKKGEPVSYRGGHDGAVRAYAEALGITPEKAAEKINLHNEYEYLFQRSGGLRARP